MAGFAALASVASGVVGAIGALKSSQAQAAGTVAAAQGRVNDAKNRQVMADYEATQLERAGKQDMAIASQKMQEQRKKKKLVLSALTARYAGSGFDPDEGDFEDLYGDIEDQGSQSEQIELYKGKVGQQSRGMQAAGIRTSAEATLAGANFALPYARKAAAAQTTAGMAGAFGSFTKGLSSSYGGGGPYRYSRTG